MEGSRHVNCNSIIYRKRTVHRTEIERLFLAAKGFNTIQYIFFRGSSIKYAHSDFVILDLPPKEDMTDIFCEFLSIKEPQTTLQNKETTIQSYWKMSKNPKQRYKIKKLLYKAIGKCPIKTPRRALRLSLRFLTIQGRWERIILAV